MMTTTMKNNSSTLLGSVFVGRAGTSISICVI